MGLIEAGESYRRVHDLLRERAPRRVPTQSGGHASESAARFAGEADQRQQPGLGQDIGAILRMRRSVREFSSEPIGLRQLQRLVTAAYALSDDLWPASRHGALPITVIAAASAVPGAEPGLLRVAPGGCDRIGALDVSLDVTLRREYADAPMILFLCADPHQLGHGGGYGSVLVRTGATGYAIWLAAIADGLQASVYGGSSNDITCIARQVNSRLRHLFTAAVGWEDKETSRATSRT
jgi:nitroreductase